MQKPKQQYLRLTVLFSCLIVSGLFSPHVTAVDVSHGELAGAIRSAEYPCAHVRQVDSNGDNAWIVQCNSGKFNVSRDQNGDFTVIKID